MRFNGVYLNPPARYRFFHCDSWRENLQPGLWLPVYVYSEEQGLKLGRLRGQAQGKRQEQR